MSKTIVELSDAQLSAYNRRDLDGFCACFSDDVRVLDETGQATLVGAVAFRARYGELFGKWSAIGANVIARITLGPHVIEHESYFRKDSQGVVQESGEVIVRYTKRNSEAGSHIALVEFLRG
jgi:hypothetical protein